MKGYINKKVINIFFSAENSLGGVADYRATVYPDGSVYYNFPSVITTLCKVDVTYFPFDTQTCNIHFDEIYSCFISLQHV